MNAESEMQFNLVIKYKAKKLIEKIGSNTFI